MIKMVTALHDLLKVAYHCLALQKTLRDIKSRSKAVIIGNGPSFSGIIEKYPNGLPERDCYCVNSFPLTSSYEVFKPRACVFADPAFWKLDASDPLISNRNKIFDVINEKTAWDTFILLPHAAKSEFTYCFTNNHIVIMYYNSTCISEALPLSLRCKLYRKNMAIAGMQTVVCGALSLAISLGYKQINLVGTDASFLEDVIMDDSANMLVTVDRHYYDGDKKSTRPIYSDVEETKPMLVHEYLGCIVAMLKGYYECALFAEKYGVCVVNSCSHSWIDSFKRGSIG